MVDVPRTRGKIANAATESVGVGAPEEELIKITPEMIAAGVEVLSDNTEWTSNLSRGIAEDYVKDILRAALAVALAEKLKGGPK